MGFVVPCYLETVHNCETQSTAPSDGSVVCPTFSGPSPASSGSAGSTSNTSISDCWRGETSSRTLPKRLCPPGTPRRSVIFNPTSSLLSHVILRQSTFVRHSPLPPVMVQWSAQLSAVPPLPLPVVLGPRRTRRSLIVGAAIIMVAGFLPRVLTLLPRDVVLFLTLHPRGFWSHVILRPFLLFSHLRQLRHRHLLSQAGLSTIVRHSHLRPVAAQGTAHLSAGPPLPSSVVLEPCRIRSLIVGAAIITVAGFLP